MTCGLIRLICEEPAEPPPDGDGQAQRLVVDVPAADVPAEVLRLQAQGWRVISEWPL